MSDFQPRNFATHALEALRSLLAGASPAEAAQVTYVRLQEAAYWLEHSVKFVAPRDGEFLERLDLLQDDVDFPRLPYPAICLEYEYTPRTTRAPDGVELAEPEFQPDRVAVLAFYPSDRTPVGRLVAARYGAVAAGEFVVWPVLGFGAGRAVQGEVLAHDFWTPVPDPVLVTQDLDRDWSIEFRRSDVDKRMGLYVLVEDETLAMRVASKQSRGLAAPSVEAMAREVVNDTAGEALAIVELCNVLECSNVHTTRWAASPKLNKKRLAAAKPPFFDYQLLELAEGESRGGAGEGDGEGTQGTRRQHYRRGHIRRLHSGKKTWVRPHLVGDASAGVRLKDYDVRARRG